MGTGIAAMTRIALAVAATAAFILGCSAAEVPTPTAQQMTPPPEAKPTPTPEPPTPEQLGWLKLALENPVSNVGTRPLKEALAQPANEGLALEVLRQARELKAAGRKDENSFHWLLIFLHSRSGTQDLAIDGPYLKSFAQLILELMEESFQEKTGRVGGISWQPLVIYLKAHPEDKDLRDRTKRLALANAKVSTFQLPRDAKAEQIRDSGYHHRVHARLGFSWNILLQLGVLHDGIDVDKAVEILGEPTSKRDNKINWHYDSMMHINPAMDARIEKYKIVEFKRYIR